MHITYNFEDFDKTELMQGDVLERTPALDKLLAQVHPHFYASSKNLYFVVLTQTCDLVPREGGVCKAPYISLAPARSLDWLLEKHIGGLSSPNIRAALPVVANKNKVKTREFLQRLVNNNEPGYFFLDAKDTPLSEDCAAVLNLSIAIKASLHYNVCLDAKIIQLNDAFQAKLGWLVGQLYSRVGTQDWPPDVVNAKIKKITADIAIWVDDRSIKEIEDAYELAQHFSYCHGRRREERIITAQEISKAVSAIPNCKKLVLDAVMRVIKTVADTSVVETLQRKLQSDAGLNSLFKE